jgi:hypothetical protein
LAPFTASNPEKTIQAFRSYIAELLNSTITDAPLSIIVARRSASELKAALSLGGKTDIGRAVPLRQKPLHLFLVQSVAVIREGKAREWRLKTLQYSYRIQGGPSFDSEWYFRFEYKSREIEDSLHPRRHLHLPVSLNCGTKRVDLSRVHIPTGHVAIEELIRFLIEELGVKAKTRDWDSILQKTEEKFSLPI